MVFSSTFCTLGLVLTWICSQLLLLQDMKVVYFYPMSKPRCNSGLRIEKVGFFLRLLLICLTLNSVRYIVCGFDFSQCPLTQPFHIFVYNHHFRELFNFKYPATVDSFVTQSSHLTFWHMYSLTLTSTHIYKIWNTHNRWLNIMLNAVSPFWKFLPSCSHE